jgi:ferredoxin-thioredoxin reductase catalytic subunit
MDELWNDACPCGHTWDEHNFDVGCIAGWEYEGPDPGVASKDGCYCQLAHTEKSIG